MHGRNSAGRLHPTMTAEALARALGGRRNGSGWMARCPAHDDREPSLSIRGTFDGRVLVRCHAGCDQARVVETLRSLGLWQQHSCRFPRIVHPVQRQTGGNKGDTDGARRTAIALGIWRATRPAEETLVEAYLRSRGLRLGLPATLRFHPGLKHPSGGLWPTMVALVTRGTDDAPLGVHRTFIARDGNAKAPVDPQKMMLGPTRGGAVRLAEAGDVLMIGEGIETCLAAMQASGLPAWAALSTSGLRAFDLPKDVLDVIVLADGDEAGEAAARNCALRWKRQGRRVRVARPPQGMDFNDMLPGRAPEIEEGAQ